MTRLQAATPAPLISVGESVSASMCLSREQIAAFARLTEDRNPLHHDLAAAQRARFGEVIASGQHTASRLMGLVASHFSDPTNGVARDTLCLNFNFAFKAPVFADQEITLHWCVSAVEPNQRRGGFIGHLDGEARSGSRVCVVGRGTLLVRPAG
ncbi:MAG: MaoC family dehydratase [Pseudomonadota bacterium]|nr:MaoC family dehydratase [Pseudomonadota bacterium]